MNWKNMMKNVGKASPLVLSLFGVVGVICTAVLSAKCTPKAQKLLEEKYRELDSDTQLSPIKKAVVMAPAYLPAAGVGAITIAAIVSSNLLSRRQNLSLAATCTLLQRNFHNYKDKVKELFGPEADQKVQDGVAKERFDIEQVQHKAKAGMAEMFLWLEPNTMQWFWATEADILKVEYEVNRLISQEGSCTLREYCNMLEIEAPDGSENIGWSYEDFMQNWDSFWVDFQHRYIEYPEEDMPAYYVIDTPISPEWDFVLDERPLPGRLTIDDDGCYAWDVR